MIDELLQTRTRYHADGSQERVERRRAAPPAAEDNSGPEDGSVPASWRSAVGALAGLLLAIALILGGRAWAEYRRGRTSAGAVEART